MSTVDSSTRHPLVYFVRFGESGPIKIGQSKNDVRHRLTILQISCPEQLYLLATIPEPTDELCEQAIHARFAHLRIRGEWFDATIELTNFIAGHAVPFAHDPRYITGVGERGRPLYPSETWRWTKDFDEDEPRPVPTPGPVDDAQKMRLKHIGVIALNLSGMISVHRIVKLLGINLKTYYKWLNQVREYSDPEAVRLRQVFPDKFIIGSACRFKKETKKRATHKAMTNKPGRKQRKKIYLADQPSA